MNGDDTNDPHPDRTPIDRVLLFLASLGYVGFVPVASGTVSVAVVGVPLHLLLIGYFKLAWPSYTLFVVGLTLFAVWLAGHGDRILREKDSSKSVIDEIPGYLIALIGFPITWQIILAAFLLERALDIIKVPPAPWIERRVPGGWGVVLDDVVAGLYALGLLHLLAAWFPNWLGL